MWLTMTTGTHLPARQGGNMCANSVFTVDWRVLNTLNIYMVVSVFVGESCGLEKYIKTAEHIRLEHNGALL